MSTIKNFKAGRAVPKPDERSLQNFRLWSYGNMRPIHTIPKTITLDGTNKSYLDIFIPANTWAVWHRLLIFAQVNVLQNPLPPPNPPTYTEGYLVNGLNFQQRTAPAIMAVAPSTTQFIMRREFYLDPVFDVFEANFQTFGNASLPQVKGAINDLLVTIGGAGINPTIDNTISITCKTNNALNLDQISVGTSQAYIQAPLNLNRFPQ